jgi:aquaporin Z
MDPIMYKYLAEFAGSFLLMLVIFVTGNYLAIGATLALIFLALGNVSGAAVNPAVAIGYYAAGKISKHTLLPYIIAEIFGALMAFEVYKRFF